MKDTSTKAQWEHLAHEAIQDAQEWKQRANALRSALMLLRNCPDLGLDELDPITIEALDRANAELLK